MDGEMLRGGVDVTRRESIGSKVCYGERLGHAGTPRPLSHLGSRLAECPSREVYACNRESRSKSGPLNYFMRRKAAP